ncbi:MAG: ComF family protein [Gammaproteobacteria bacterium]|nr:ComF family protein [Gammaproteobacteria bacterium]
MIGVKFARRLAWARALGELLAGELPAAEIDIVVPVPLHPTRLAVRGFNQAQEIAVPVAHRLARPLRPEAVRRCRATRPQSTLSAADRQSNMAGAFRVHRGAVEGRRVLLVDDVVTTGATATALALAVAAAGATEVTLAAVARA